MKLKRLAVITGLFLASLSSSLHAADFRQANILQAYYQALKSDPTFKRANADWESAKENLPIARAAYLTQVALTGNAQRQYNNAFPPLSVPNSNGYNYNYGFVLTVTQPVFNLPAWDAIRSARASVKSATATFSSASQDLMVRTIRAYVSVLQAYDQLRFQLARKNAVFEQLKVARQQFKVGLIAITGVYDARSVYDQAVAQSIADQNTLNDAVEELAEITGIHYLRLRGIGKRVPLVMPMPNNINTWADIAERQNYSLVAQNYAVIAARDTLKQQSTSWMPQLSIAGQYTNDNETTLRQQGGGSAFGTTTTRSVLPAIRTNNVLYGFSLNFPIVQGGLVSANTRQAKYNYLSASSQREFIYRSVVSNTRQSFLGIITGISKIKADWQSVTSAQNALNATKAGYEVGTRTMVDVLDDVTSLYQAQQQYTDDQYTYIIDTIELKFNAGTLSVDDIKTINRWLKKDIKLNLPGAALKSLQSRLRPIKSFPNVPNAHLKKSKQTLFALPKKVVVPKPAIMKALNLPAHATKTVAIPEPAKKMPHKRVARAAFNIPAPKYTRRFYPRKKLTPPSATSTLTKKRTAKSRPKKIVRHHIVSLKKKISPAYGGDRALGSSRGRAQAPLGSPSARVSTLWGTGRAGEILPVKKLGRLGSSFLYEDQRIIPLYEMPSPNRHNLPAPS